MNPLDYLLKKYNVKPDRFIRLDVKRETLGELFKELGFNKGAEVGTEKGIFAEVLLKANPELELYCIDAWKAYDGYRDFVFQTTLDGFEPEARERLAPYNVHILKGWSMDKVKEIEDESLDFVYIDGNHDFSHVTEDITAWSKKVHKGGIIAGHDYIRLRTTNSCQVKAVVDAMECAFRMGPVFILAGNPYPSYMWVK